MTEKQGCWWCPVAEIKRCWCCPVTEIKGSWCCPVSCDRNIGVLMLSCDRNKGVLMLSCDRNKGVLMSCDRNKGVLMMSCDRKTGVDVVLWQKYRGVDGVLWQKYQGVGDGRPGSLSVSINYCFFCFSKCTFLGLSLDGAHKYAIIIIMIVISVIMVWSHSVSTSQVLTGWWVMTPLCFWPPEKVFNFGCLFLLCMFLRGNPCFFFFLLH